MSLMRKAFGPRAKASTPPWVALPETVTDPSGRTGYRCSAPRCMRIRHARGFCGSHGRMEASGMDLWVEDIWVAKRLGRTRLVGDCWIWEGNKNNHGYGLVGGGAEGKSQPAHRWFYERFVSHVPSSLVLDHLCRTPLCVNPKHLEPVTLAENTRRGFESRGLGLSRTHCVRGHLWNSENVRITQGRRPGTVYRRCIVCQRERDHQRHLKKMAEKAEGAMP